MKYTVFPTALGWIGVAGGPAGLIRLTPPRSDRLSATSEVAAGLGPMDVDEAAFGDVQDQFARYFQGERVPFDFALDERRISEFTRQIYRHCRAIPPGQVFTYRALAEQAGRPGAARAVGRAMATNPWPIVVPCHRVVGSDGTLRGYGGGLSMKSTLLALEQGRPIGDT